MNTLKAPSLQSLLESDRGSNDSLLAESLQLDIDELDDFEYSIPAVDKLPTLESVLSEIDSDLDSASGIFSRIAPTPTPSMDESQRLGSILKHSIVQGITTQLISAVERVNSGLAISAAVSEMIAIGTSHGHILAFDVLHVLKWCFRDITDQGAISALSFNEDDTRLLAGFARGHIVMIDTSSGDIIRSLPDVITPNSGVLHLKWTGKPALALCSDSGGSVWSLSFTRRLGIRGCDSRCLFSGSRGEVCAVEPLILSSEEQHPLKSYSITALATLSKFFVVMVRPRLKVIKFHAMVGPPDCLPLLAWQMVLIQAADSSRAVDPVLAVARGNNLYYHQITYLNGRISLLFLRHITLTYNLLAMHWLGPKTIACLDTSEILHLNDVRTNKELEALDMSSIGLVYASAQFKGLATGGNVSPALSIAGTFACYNSVIACGNELFVLGGKSFHSVSARPWSDRISHLTTQQRWEEALELAIDGFRAAKVRPRRQIIAKERILQLFDDYIAATSNYPELCLEPVMNCLIEIKETDLLWEELWERLPTPDLYLEILTRHIENDNITKISPSVSQVLCDYWTLKSTTKLENLILKLDWQLLDLHQVLKICKTEKLYKALMYLNTKALGDYAISLTELIPLINKSTEAASLGNAILVYISSCLAGRGYPTGEIDPDIVQSVKHETLRCLTVIHSNSALDSELPYPYIRELLNFDTRETLNVIALAFQEKEFNGDLGLSQRQRIINILLDVLTPEHATWSQIGCLLNFVAHQIATRCLPEEHALLNKVMNYLSMETIENETSREHADREQSWLELLTNNCLTHMTNTELLELATKASCYRVSEYLLLKLKKYDTILDCYILDKYRHDELFIYILSNIEDEQRNIFEQITNNFDKLLIINCDKLTKIICDYYPDKIQNFIRSLRQANDKRNLYLFLNNLIRKQQLITLETENYENYLDLLCTYNPENVLEFLRSNDNYRLDNSLEIVKQYELNSASIYLYERKGDYKTAFNISLELLKEAPESTSEMSAIQVSNLCTRASECLDEAVREDLWFQLLKVVLLRTDLTLMTKNILYSASKHVDLSKLIQLVLNSGTHSGNFGDIKHLLMGMLSNSEYETLLLQTTSQILGKDLHRLLVREKSVAKKGLFIRSIKCIICRLKLFNNDNKNVIVFGVCGHALHKECSNKIQSDHQLVQCPRCGIKINEEDTICLADPSLSLLSNNNVNNTNGDTTMNLQVTAPPRVGIGERRN